MAVKRWGEGLHRRCRREDSGHRERTPSPGLGWASEVGRGLLLSQEGRWLFETETETVYRLRVAHPFNCSCCPRRGGPGDVYNSYPSADRSTVGEGLAGLGMGHAAAQP